MTLTLNFKQPLKAAETNKPRPARGSNPPGARTRNEPQRRYYKPEPEDVYKYRSPKAVPQADTYELRERVAHASLVLNDAYYAYVKALHEFEQLGPLPDEILVDLPFKIKKHLKQYEYPGAERLARRKD